MTLPDGTKIEVADLLPFLEPKMEVSKNEANNIPAIDTPSQDEDRTVHTCDQADRFFSEAE